MMKSATKNNKSRAASKRCLRIVGVWNRVVRKSLAEQGPQGQGQDELRSSWGGSSSGRGSAEPKPWTGVCWTQEAGVWGWRMQGQQSELRRRWKCGTEWGHVGGSESLAFTQGQNESFRRTLSRGVTGDTFPTVRQTPSPGLVLIYHYSAWYPFNCGSFLR